MNKYVYDDEEIYSMIMNGHITEEISTRFNIPYSTMSQHIRSQKFKLFIKMKRMENRGYHRMTKNEFIYNMLNNHE